MTIDYYANDVLYTKIDPVTNFTYVGKVRRDIFAADDAPAWLIYRECTRNGITTRIYASHSFDQKWSERYDIFPEVSFDSQYSTDLDGLNDSCNGGDVHSYDAADAFSHTLWVKPQNVAAQRALFAKATDDSLVYGWILYHNSSGQLFLQMRASGTLRSYTFTDMVLTPGVWQHVALTYAGGSNINGAKAYVNAVPSLLTPSSGSLSSMMSGQNFTQGSRNSAFNFAGLIKDHVIWNKNLSGVEVTEQYNGGELYPPSEHTAGVNARSFYRMGDGDTYPTITDNIGTADLTMLNMTADSFVEDIP